MRFVAQGRVCTDSGLKIAAVPTIAACGREPQLRNVCLVLFQSAESIAVFVGFVVVLAPRA
ncbi:MAG: hypothetical protein ACJ789_16370 [Thermomicrobiales bacterium]